MKNSGVTKRPLRSGPSKVELSHLYEADETAWLEETARLIDNRRFRALDLDNLAEYLRDMAKRDKREVASRITTLLTHLLKWHYQPRKRSRSWETTILTQQYDLQDIFDSATLKNHAAQALAKAYERAVKRASKETGLSEDRFPPTCSYTVDDLLKSL